ncbi:unnamed protein product [Rotaria sp. Silwood2]|nr:unnamed protein product [Rotaria sp. Silwood2]CAF4162512.1 unnamed protein product [Rotaria sp. Silwood2]
MINENDNYFFGLLSRFLLTFAVCTYCFRSFFALNYFSQTTLFFTLAKSSFSGASSFSGISITPMGLGESILMSPGAENQLVPLPDDWRYTIQNMMLEGRIIPIHKDNYKFRKEVGSGAFGSVYSARRVSNHKPVAIKVVTLAKLKSGETEALVESILTEISMMHRLLRASKHIVHLYDFDFHNQTGLAFLIMELGEHDLEAELKSQPRLSPETRKQIWRQLVKIALVLHENNIVHLDIKPQNLIVFPGNIIKLVDLGIAQKAHQHRINAYFLSNGTWLYSAPEVRLVPNHHVALNTSKSDVWSWGAVLYRMTYRVPPDYKPPCHHPPKNQHKYRDPDLVDILRHTLVLDPKDRVGPSWLARHPYTRKH